jgi:hypothetical protein
LLDIYGRIRLDLGLVSIYHIYMEQISLWMIRQIVETAPNQLEAEKRSGVPFTGTIQQMRARMCALELATGRKFAAVEVYQVVGSPRAVAIT